MTRTIIIVADAARSRFFTLPADADPSVDGGPRLVEQQDLVNPDADLAESDLFSDRSGRGHASPGGSAHALDDHRQAHRRELERRYARELVGRIVSFAWSEAATRAILVAP